MDALWDAPQVDVLKARRKDGWTASMIAAVIGVSRSAVCAKMNRLGMKAEPKPLSMSASAIKCRKSRAAKSSEAEEMGIETEDVVARRAAPHISPGMRAGEKYRPTPPVPVSLGDDDGRTPAPGCLPLEQRSGVANAILHRSHVECAWPIGAVDADDFHFCSALVRKIGEPYCEEHFQRAKPKP
jgi:hypothetical protein